jgi:hypothetical protein
MTDKESESKGARRAIIMLYHNCIAHPIAGVLWLFGFNKLGDYIHNHRW